MQIIQSIQNRIYEIRGERVMLDRDLAVLYKVETRVFNQSVKRNIKRFPKDFMFQLTKQEWEELKADIYSREKSMSSQFVTTYPRQASVVSPTLRIYRTWRSYVERHPKQRSCH